MHDLVIRGGNIVDGTGAPGFVGDVAVDDGVITAVGEVDRTPANARSTPTGLAVMPGWVDIHTHYDGQVTWDPEVTPSSWHGVTTVVMGNCGVGFAPVRPDGHDFLIELMEGVEDIPGTALHEGIDWQWESFPEYLDALDATPRVLDVAAQVPHAALRAYVMGERAHDDATADEIAEMAGSPRRRCEAGAVGFTHVAHDPAPLEARARPRHRRRRPTSCSPSATRSADAGHGVFQLIADGSPGRRGRRVAWPRSPGAPARPSPTRWPRRGQAPTGLPRRAGRAPPRRRPRA